MGIGPEPAALLRSLELPKGFSVIELGDQIHHQGRRSINGQPNPEWWSRPARELYAELGCGKYDSIDANGRGTITADLNYPLDPFPGQYDLCSDFGTIEHLGDPCQGWRTLHQLCKPGGLIVGDKPETGYLRHGLFLHDKSFFSALARSNGYKIVHFSAVHAGRGTCRRFVFRKAPEESTFRPAYQGKWHYEIELPNA